jgi:Domain of unknown function (DUF4062)
MSYKAFVSSTFEDLKEHRRHVIGALRKAGFFVDPMEDWTAASDEPKQFSQDRLEGCGLCVLLVAFRRGYVPKGEKRSITQFEYDAAVKLGVDALVFMLDELAPWPRKFDELEKDPEIKLWRTELMEKSGVGFFGLAPESIEIAPALTRWLAQKSGGKGDTTRAQFADEINEATVKFVLAIQYAERRSIKQEQYDSAYEEWELNHGRIESCLRSSFHKAELAKEWSRLAEAITALYRLSGTWSEPNRSKVLSELRDYFSESATDWDCLRNFQKSLKSNEEFQTYFAAWWRLREATLSKTRDEFLPASL